MTIGNQHLFTAFGTSAEGLYDSKCLSTLSINFYSFLSILPATLTRSLAINGEQK